MFPAFRSIFIFALGAALSAVAVPSVAQTHWPKDGWRVIETNQTYPELLDNVKKAVVDSGLGVVFDVGPTQAAAKRGIQIPGNRVIGVFNNEFAVEILRLSVPAMIEAPLRLYVTERRDGRATLAWIEPSHIYAPFIAAMGKEKDAGKLRAIARRLDAILNGIASKATASG